METAQIDSFLAVVDAGSFTRAAARLHRAQPGSGAGRRDRGAG
ncbi:MAG: LysR family transcriptional regulator, partial [Chloroflexi bacterium]|nr:LysR family transcriptional regulator [Chloroflexota bacterium]